jgi:4'-phosphopantetheinyl transferase EntD
MKLLPLPSGWEDVALIASFASAVELDSLLEAFTPAEREIVSTLVTAKRRFEWIASRYAAKLLAVRRGDCARLMEATVASRNGRPLLSFPRPKLRFVSLSHSGSCAGAAIGSEPVGIDVQEVRTISSRATHLFLSDDESGAIERCAVDQALLHFWCAKEAAWKRRSEPGTTLKKTPLLLERSEGEALLFSTSDGARVETRRLEAGLIAALAR